MLDRPSRCYKCFLLPALHLIFIGHCLIVPLALSSDVLDRRLHETLPQCFTSAFYEQSYS